MEFQAGYEGWLCVQVVQLESRKEKETVTTYHELLYFFIAVQSLHFPYRNTQVALPLRLLLAQAPALKAGK